VSYLRGSEPSGWESGIPTYARVRYDEVYPGVDLLFHGSRGQLEYDFVVAPGADPSRIGLLFRGAALRLSARGDLVSDTPAGRIVHRAPLIYQETPSGRREVPGGFQLDGHRVTFSVGEYDAALALVIDPQVLAYSTFLGGSGGEEGLGIAVDDDGSAYVTGNTVDQTVDYPTTPGAYDVTHNGGTYDAFVTKVNAAGTDVVYSTFLGGSGQDSGTGIAVDGSGNAYVTGYSEDATTDYPTTTGAYDQSHNGGFDVVVTKLNATGTAPLTYSTFLGGTLNDFASGIAVDGLGNAYLTGRTADATTDYPVTTGAYDESHNGNEDAFVTKLNATGSAPTYSTFLGGLSADNGHGIAVDGAGAAYVTGESSEASAPPFPTTTGAYSEENNGSADVFVTKMNVAGSALTYSTFIGGSGIDIAYGIALDGSGNAHVTGQTADATTDFPITTGAYDGSHNGNDDAFATKMNAAGTDLMYSTLLGGSGGDLAQAIAVDGAGTAYLTGFLDAASTDFPTTSGALAESANGGEEAFVTKVNAAGTSLVYSTFLGGSATDFGKAIAVDGSGNTYVTGYTFDDTTDFPTTAGAYDEAVDGLDAFVAKLGESTPDLDTAAPDTTITGGKKKTTKPRVKISFTSTEPGSTFQCAIDEKAFAPCTSPKKQKIKPGKHVFFVRAVDAAGNTDPTPAKKKVKRIEK
jgi:hypothetical protein